MLVAVFAVLSVVFMGISLALPWYTLKASILGQDATTNLDFSGSTTSAGGASTSQKWSDVKTMDKTKGVYSLTQILVILGLVMCILLLIGSIMLIRGGPSKKMLAMIFGILAFIFAMLGPVMFMVQHPGAYKSDSGGTDPGYGPANSFSGSKDVAEVGTVTWGPGIGWMMALVGFIFALLGFILVLMVKKPAGIPPA
jgi:hypothetical protein